MSDLLYKLEQFVRKKEEPIRNVLLIFGGGYVFASLTVWKDILWYHIKYPVSADVLEQEVNKAIFWNSVQSVIFFVAVVSLVMGFALIFIVKPNVDLNAAVEPRTIHPPKYYRKMAFGAFLTTFGFIYQVIGAWLFWDKPYPFVWQTEIAKYGIALVLPLFVLSFVSLIVGCLLLYRLSVKR